MMIAWVTSFSPDLYNVTGREFLASAARNPLPGTFLVAPENMTNVDALPLNAIAMPDLGLSLPMRGWLKQNADIIPHDKGGLWRGPCKCKNPKGKKEQDHKMPCPAAWYCRNAARWFRKIIAIKQAMEMLGNNAILFWMDCDIIVHRAPTEAQVLAWFEQGNGQPPADVLYLKSPKRPVWETGIVGFRGLAGRRLFEAVANRYFTGGFRADQRWDDSYQLMNMAKMMPEIKCKDVATTASGHADVVPHSVYAPFFVHRKGHHSRVTKTVT